MDYKEIITQLRSVDSRSKGRLLENAAVAIETLIAAHEAACAERDVVHKRLIELEMEVCGIKQ